MVTLEQVRAKAAPELYPRQVLVGCESALVLFAAAFHGRQDAVWIADAEMQATLVDIDHEKLGEMVLAYPEGWEYVHGDVFDYCTRTERMWDVVSIDPPTNLFDRCEQLLSLWVLMANKAVVLGMDDRPVVAPHGWQLTEVLRRSNFAGGVYWQVFQPC